ncbi:MAG: HAD family hydrolase [Trueperaceae bacterium]|nr:HAD family hydrolase [Trueperaceae bacterium]
MTVVFDLDDTLVLERDYVKSGFAAVANELGDERYFDVLWQAFLAGRRGDSFNQLLELEPDLKSRLSVAELVAFYRTHKPNLSLSKDRLELIRDLKKAGAKLAIISDGPLTAQQAKVEALGLARLFDLILLTDKWGKEFWKPHPRAYREVEKLAPAERYCFIGDNPHKDFSSAYARGWDCFCLRLEHQLHRQVPINSQEEVKELFSVRELRQALEVIFTSLNQRLS